MKSRGQDKHREKKKKQKSAGNCEKKRKKSSRNNNKKEGRDQTAQAGGKNQEKRGVCGWKTDMVGQGSLCKATGRKKKEGSGIPKKAARDRVP